MATPLNISRRSFLGLGAASAGAALLAACGGESAPPANGPQTINWWHIQTGEPLKPIWDDLINQYQTAHTNVKIVAQPIENEAFKKKLTTNMQAGSPPDLYQSWGGGVLKEQVAQGMVKDLTADTSSWISSINPIALQPYTVDGKLYGIPWDMGMVGFWYNKDLFAKAGITAAPATWAELLDDVSKLKAKGVTPIALAGADKWPGHFYWSYLAVRIAGLDAFKQADASKSWDNPDFVQAGVELKKLVDLAPFQKGFLGAGYGTPDGQAATVGNGKAALELMGQWAPAVESSSAADKKGLGDKLGWFPFPAVDGGKGKLTDAFGGGNGFAVGKNAPAATLDFLKFLMNDANQRIETSKGGVLPTNKAAADAITDANAKLVSQALNSATGIQLYLDQYFAPAVGAQVNDSVAALIAGQKSPQQVTQEITATAKTA
jgi:raffinose/stachyose/melibiose transport system substrate-binding protein